METASNFTDLYKGNKVKISDRQDERRRQILEKQKELRSKVQDDNRNGLKDFIQKLRRKSHRQTYQEKYHNNQRLQLSEWLRERPEDLDRWFLVPCPKGQRCLVIASEGHTEMYNKNGRFVFTFSSNLPGSSSDSGHYTVLDCIRVEESSAFYVLDVMAYNNIDMVFCETQFRFFWIKSKLLENPSITEISEYNKHRFVPLDFYDFEDSNDIGSCLQRYPPFEDKNVKLDGYLFYHKDAHYEYGETPLVGWLFAFMMPEVLSLQVHEKYMDEIPPDYTNYEDYMRKFDEEMTKKRKWHRRKEKCKNQNGNDSHEEIMALDILDSEKALEMYGERIDDSCLDEDNTIG